MTRSKQPDAGATSPPVGELLEQRARILGWMARLDEVDDAESRRVVERVRADYQRRLDTVVGELSAHLESLRAELDAARERSSRLEEIHADAGDALHEARLRHRIGEIPQEEWEARRGELERAVAGSLEDLEGSAAEVSRLEEVLGQIDTGVLVAPLPALEPAPDSEATMPEGRPAPRRADPLPEALPVPVPTPAAPPEEVAREEPAKGVDDDFAFLEELDRAIAASGVDESLSEAPDGDGGEDDEEEEIDTRPAKGMKCLECGYTNDAAAWYCGVCGVELP